MVNTSVLFFRVQILFDQAQRSIKQQLHTFIKEWVPAKEEPMITCRHVLTFFFFNSLSSGTFASLRTRRSSLTVFVRTWSWLRWRTPRRRGTKCTKQKRPRRPWSWAAKPSDTWHWTTCYRWNCRSFLKNCPIGGAARLQQQLNPGDSQTQF